MNRSLYGKMKRWKESGGRTALLIDGARRVGKSYLAETFARNEYRSYILIDFNRAGDEVKTLFNHHLNDLDTFYRYLSALFGVKLYERESVIVLDEVQLFPRARAAIKYLVQDGRYDFIETGYLMSIRSNVQDIVIPSEEHHVKLYPLTFAEFLEAQGDDMLMPFIQDCFTSLRPMGQALHRKAMDQFRRYMITGGMPQAVQAYIDGRDFEEIDEVKRDILSQYRADIAKHSARCAGKARSIFDELPAQLRKRGKKFNLCALKKSARYREYEEAFFLLDDAMIINPCFCCSEPDAGLRLNMERHSLKCYMADTGLLVSHAFDENSLISEGIYRKLLLGKLEFNRGMLTENVVAQMLTASGHKLYFYSCASRDDASSRMEIDFLIRKKEVASGHNISPIEVKSGKNYTLSSLRKCMAKYGQYLHDPYVIHAQDLKKDDGITYIPCYMTPLL